MAIKFLSELDLEVTSSILKTNASGVIVAAVAGTDYVSTSGYNNTNWNTAYGWGDHGSVGYLTSYSETDTLDTVADRGATTDKALTIGSSATGGGRILSQNYSGSNRLGVVSSQNSSGNLVIGYGAEGKSGAAGFVSTFGNFSGRHSALVFSGNALNWYVDASSSQTAIGSDLTLNNKFSVSDAGALSMGDGFTSTKGNTAYTYSQVGHLPLAGGTLTGALELGVYASTVQGVLKLNGTTANKQSVIKTTNGNLHIDAADGHNMYLNYYTGGSTSNIIFGSGNGGASGATVSSTGVITATGGTSTQWNTAYSWGDHSVAGYAATSHTHSYLPLAGGTLSGALTGTTATFSGDIKQSTRTTLLSNGTITWGSNNDYGTLSWDTGYALYQSRTGKGIKLQTNGASNALTLDTSQNASFAGNLEVQGADVTITANIIHAGDPNTYFGFNTNDSWRVVTGGTQALILDSSQNATFAGKVITTEVESASTILLDAAADITIDAGGGDIILSDDATIFGTISSGNGSNLQIRSRINNADMFFRGVDDGTEFNALTLDMSAGGNATFAGDITSAGLTVDYTGNRTGDAGILVTNDSSDWGIKVDKDGTTDYGILSQTDGDNAIVVRNAAGTTNIQLQGDGNATFAGNIALTGGGTIEAPSSAGNEALNLIAAGGINLEIDSNGNTGDDQYFKIYKHSIGGTALFSVKETGDVTATGTIAASNLSGTNTGDQTLPTASSLGAVTLTGNQTISGVKQFSNYINAASNIHMAGHLYNGDSLHSIDLKDHNDYTWFRNAANTWTFQGGSSGDDWTQSFSFKLEGVGAGYNDKFMLIGQQENNGTGGGRYKGVRIVKSTGSGTVVDGDLQAGDLTVTGNLTVNGTTTTINTATVEVEDNILQLNTTQGSPDTATAATSGISIYRGDGVTQASLIFDDADDTWDLTNRLIVAGTVVASNFSGTHSGSSSGTNTGDQTASEILTAIKTVDGSGSGLDADLLDGLSSSQFAKNYTFDIGSSGASRRYIKLWTMTDTDDGVSGFLSMGGDYGDEDKAAYQLIVGTRSGNISMDVFETSVGTVSDNFDFFYKDIGTSYEIWMLASDYNYTGQTAFIPVSTFGGVTYNFDSITTTTPTDLVSVSKNTIWHSGIDGAASGLDADKLDGQQGTHYLARANHTGTQAYSTLTGTPTIPSGNAIIDWTAAGAGTIHADNYIENVVQTTVSGNAGTVTNGVYTIGTQTIGGAKTFSSTITGSVSGNAGTATALQSSILIAQEAFDGTGDITLDNNNITNGAGYTTYTANQALNTTSSPTFNTITANGALYVNWDDTSSSINMQDSDSGSRQIHCNSNYIGFLNQASSWAFAVDDTGNTKNWFSSTIIGDLNVSGGTTLAAPAAPTSLVTSIVNDTINVTFTASTTSGISNYLVFSSVAGGDYGLISVIPPADFAATMSVIDNSFDTPGTQAYRVYAVKNGVYSSPLTGSKAFSAGTVEVTGMSAVNLNKAFYVQWDSPSSNARFVTAYNVYKHEHATAASLAEGSATLVYSGMNTNFMYSVSGADNDNFHKFWITTTIAS